MFLNILTAEVRDKKESRKLLHGTKSVTTYKETVYSVYDVKQNVPFRNLLLFLTLKRVLFCIFEISFYYLFLPNLSSKNLLK